jgi:hypothetical protein
MALTRTPGVQGREIVTLWFPIRKISNPHIVGDLKRHSWMLSLT